MRRLWQLRALVAEVAPTLHGRQRCRSAWSTSGRQPLGGSDRFRTLASTSAVPVQLVKELRDRTGASMGKCREALGEEGGDVEKAVDWLRRRGIRSMEKRTAEAAEALFALHVAGDGSAGAIVELRAETDFVTRGELFQQLCVCLAQTAVGCMSSGGASALAEAELADTPSRPKQVRPGTPVAAALLELGSVVGERFVLGEVLCLPAPAGGVVAGYVHPKQADGVANTGRMGALVAIQPLPPTAPCDAERLRSVAAQLARHVAAAQPRFVSIPSIPAEVLHRERETFRAAYVEQLAPRKAGIIEEGLMSKVVDGKTQKFYSETVLLCQELVAPQAVGTGAKGEEKPLPVAEWLEAEARDMSLEKIAVDSFRFASL